MIWQYDSNLAKPPSKTGLKQRVRGLKRGLLWPLLAAPLLAGCYAPPPAVPYYAFGGRFVPPPPRFIDRSAPLYGDGLMRPVQPIIQSPALSEPRGEAPTQRHESTAPSAAVVRPEPPAPAGAATGAAPGSGRPPEREADASLHSPTCGYWRLGCGILWP